MHFTKSLTMSAAMFGTLLFMSSALAAQSPPRFQHLHGGVIENVHFLDEDHGWTAEDGGRIRRTTDGGQTWEQAFVPEELELQVQLRGLFFMEVSGEVLGWAVGDGGVVLRSDDGDGMFWEDANPESRIINNIGDPNTCEPYGLLAELYSIFMLDELTGWVVGNDGVLQLTLDGGETWLDSESLYFSLPGLFNCGADPYDAYQIHWFEDSGAGYDPFDKGVILSEFGKLLTTDDAGMTWSVVYVPSELSFQECPSVASRNLEFWSISLEDATDASSDAWLSGGIGFNIGYLFQTTGLWDSNSWSQSYCYEGLAPADFEAEDNCSVATIYGVADLGSTDPKRFSGGYGGGIFVLEAGTANFDPCECESESSPTGCTTNGPTWVEKDPETAEVDPDQCSVKTPFFGVAKINATEACAVGSFGRIVTYDYDASGEDELTDRANLNFTRIAAGDFITETVGCVTGQGYQILRTTDGGATWTDVSAAACTTANLDETNWDLAFSSSGQFGIAVGTNGYVAYSTDYGASWTEGTNNDTSDLHGVAFGSTESDAYAVGADGTVRKTQTYGAAWRDMASPGEETLYGVTFINDDEGYVSGADRTIYVTTEGASSWAAVAFDEEDETRPNLMDISTWGDGFAAVAVGQSGSVSVKNGTTSEYELVSGLGVTETLLDVQVLVNGSDIDLRIGGHEGVVLFRDADTWSQVRSYTNNPIHRVSFQDSDHGFALGQNFVILEYTD